MDRVDAVEQIFAKLPPPRYHSEQVAVRGADEADVHRYGRVAAHAEDTPALDGRQQLRLQVGRQVADLVEEKRPLVGLLEQPFLILGGTREAAGTVAEQFAFEQFLGESRTVDGDERPLRARAGVVDGLRKDLLAGSGFSSY